MKHFSAFDILALIYGVIAIRVGMQLYKERKQAFDNNFTPADRKLVASATFYFAVPVAVLLHELGHAVATWILGGHVEKFHFAVYWGYVMPSRTPPFHPLDMAAIAMTGNVVSLALGFTAGLWVLRRPYNAAYNFASVEFMRMILGLTLFFYPALSLIAREGDFWILRESLNQLRPHYGDAAIALYAVFGAWMGWIWRRPSTQKVYQQLASPVFDSRKEVHRLLVEDPNNPVALRELGRIELAADDTPTALSALRKSTDLKENDPVSRYLLGLALLKTGESTASCEELCKAGNLLEDLSEEGDRSQDALHFEVVLALSAARLAAGDAEAAVATAEAAREERPRDPRGLFVYVDALAAAGRLSEAKTKLEDALGPAQGRLAFEIRRKLEGLSKA